MHITEVFLFVCVDYNTFTPHMPLP